MSLFQSTQKLEDEDERVADAVKDIVTHMIQIQSKCDNPNHQDIYQDDVAHDTFSHVASLNNDDLQSNFIAQLQNTFLLQCGNGNCPQTSIWNMFRRNPG